MSGNVFKDDGAQPVDSANDFRERVKNTPLNGDYGRAFSEESDSQETLLEEERDRRKRLAIERLKLAIAGVDKWDNIRVYEVLEVPGVGQEISPQEYIERSRKLAQDQVIQAIVEYEKVVNGNSTIISGVTEQEVYTAEYREKVYKKAREVSSFILLRGLVKADGASEQKDIPA